VLERKDLAATRGADGGDEDGERPTSLTDGEWPTSSVDGERPVSSAPSVSVTPRRRPAPPAKNARGEERF
jgi:hypothetical protein